MTDQNENSNGFLYFIVGALVIAVIGIGYMYTQESGDAEGFAVIETSAGDEGDSSSFEFEVNDNGFEAKSTNSE